MKNKNREIVAIRRRDLRRLPKRIRWNTANLRKATAVQEKLYKPIPSSLLQTIPTQLSHSLSQPITKNLANIVNMVRPKPRSSKKSKQGGVDFKKVKHKVGRKLPPPKNVTNLTIKSKAIILPEQSVATEKEGLSVNSRRQTLKELLMQTQHHNRKIRRDALIGMGDLALQHPKEIALHKFSVIEYLSARISDPDNVVRERLYQLLESRIFPLIKEDSMGPLISITMAYVLFAMTQLAVDVRLTAFKFLDLVVTHYPVIVFLYAQEDIYRKDRMGPYRLGLPILKEAHPGSSLIQETDPNQDDWSKRSYLKVLDNYMDILQNNQSCFQDKSKLKAVSTSLRSKCVYAKNDYPQLGSSIQDPPSQWWAKSYTSTVVRKTPQKQKASGKRLRRPP
ncbi:hypothetical protein AMTR_s00008p00095900 [Amborella trichopoda]|uniref:Uncharacterized protein n=1 Tax=Amborella trichopoda TaxID=13333 RepID=W1NJE5_AMBTC|nr:hypothetical protein AMTR_s00008p00095900 [Amborella trichopoda]